MVKGRSAFHRCPAQKDLEGLADRVAVYVTQNSGKLSDADFQSILRAAGQRKERLIKRTRGIQGLINRILGKTDKIQQAIGRIDTLMTRVQQVRLSTFSSSSSERVSSNSMIPPTSVPLTSLETGSSQRAARVIPSGMGQIGNSCYIASTISALIASETLKAKVMADLTRKTEEAKSTFEERQLVHMALRDVVESVEGHKGQSIIREKLRQLRETIFDNKQLNSDLSRWKRKSKRDAEGKVIVDSNNRSVFDGYEKKSVDPTRSQHDAATLMNLLLEVIDYKMEGKEKYGTKNQDLGEQAISLSTVQIGLKNDQEMSLQALVDKHFAREEKQDPNNKFNGHTDWWKKDTLEGNPNVVVVQVKRFDEFGRKIALPVGLSAHGIIDFSKAFGEDVPRNYQLVGSIRHAGGVEGGHYISNVSCDGQWYECDDSAVSKISTNQDGKHFQNYILIFERRA